MTDIYHIKHIKRLKFSKLLNEAAFAMNIIAAIVNAHEGNVVWAWAFFFLAAAMVCAIYRLRRRIRELEDE